MSTSHARPAPVQVSELEETAHLLRRALGASGIAIVRGSLAAPSDIMFADTGMTFSENPAASIQQASADLSGVQIEWLSEPSSGLPPRLVASLPFSGALITIVAQFASCDDTDRSNDARLHAERVLPLATVLLQRFGEQRDMTAHAAILTAALNNLAIGVVVVDVQGHVTFANAKARNLFADGSALRCTGEMLTAMRLVDTMRLQAAINHVIEAPSESAVRDSAPVVALGRPGGRPLMVVTIGADTGPAADAERVAIVYVFDPEQDLRAVIEPTCKLYALSPVETRLTCMLCSGISLADAAVSMHVREQSARTYLKQIFQKTETNRQAELVCLMLKSAVWVTAECRANFI